MGFLRYVAVDLRRALCPVHHVHGLPDISNWPRFLRPFHPKMHRHWVAIGLGVVLMLSGSVIAGHAHDVAFSRLVDAFGYFIHGIGMIPVARHLEPFWNILIQE